MSGGASVLYDIFMSPVKLESSGLSLRHRYAVMGDFRGGKKAPLNPAATAVQSYQHSTAGVLEVNWALRTRFEFPFQFPFTAAKARKEFQISILDGGVPENSQASPTNSKVIGEAILNVGDYCRVLDGDCCHRLVEIAFKIQGRPAILSLQLLMAPNGIPPESIEPAPELVARAQGGTAVGEGGNFLGNGGKVAKQRGSITAAVGVGAASTAAASARGGAGGRSRNSNKRLISMELLSRLMSIGAIDESVWMASNGEPIEVDADVADELTLTMQRLDAAEKQKAAALSATGGGGALANISNYEAQTGPIGESVFAIRTQKTPQDALIASTMAKVLRAELEQGRAHAQRLAPSNNDIFTVDTDKAFVARNNATTSSSSASGAERVLRDELASLEKAMAQLEREQTRRDVTSDVCYALERKALVEEQLKAVLLANNSNTTNSNPSGGAGGCLDHQTRLELLQELVATERAVELLEWKKRARAQMRQALATNANSGYGAVGSRPVEESFASLQTTLEPPLPLSFAHLPPKPPAAAAAPPPAVAAAAGVGGLFDEFGFPITAASVAANASHAINAVGNNHNFMAAKATAAANAQLAAQTFGQKASVFGQNASAAADAAQSKAMGAVANQMGLGGMGAVGVGIASMAVSAAASNAMGVASNSVNQAQQNVMQHQYTQQAMGMATSAQTSAASKAAAAASAFDDFFGGGAPSPTPTAPAAVSSPVPVTSPPLQQQQSEDARRVIPTDVLGAHTEAPLPPTPASPPYVPPPAPAPSQWHQGKAAAWGSEAAPVAPPVQQQQQQQTPSPVPSAGGSLSQPPPSQQMNSSNSAVAGASGGYAQPQWNGAAAASSSSAPQQQQQQAQQAPPPRPQTDLFGEAWGSPTPAAAAAAAAVPAAVAAVPAPAPQQQQQQAPPQPQPQPQPQQQGPTSLSKANMLQCLYGGNLLSPPIARVSFDTYQHLIIQKEVGNIRVMRATGGEEKRNGIIIRFAGGCVGTDGFSPASSRGISGVLASMQWHVESEDFFSPTPLDITSAIVTITNGAATQPFAMQLVPNPPTALNNNNAFSYTLDAGSINELKPFCKGAPEDERAIMLWPSKTGSGGGGHTLVITAFFTSNGGVPVRRTTPIRF